MFLRHGMHPTQKREALRHSAPLWQLLIAQQDNCTRVGGGALYFTGLRCSQADKSESETLETSCFGQLSSHSTCGTYSSSVRSRLWRGASSLGGLSLFATVCPRKNELSLPRTSATPSPKPLRRGDSDSGGVCGFAHLLRYSILRNDARRSPASIGSGNGDSSKPPSHLTTAAPAALLPAAATAAADDEDEDVWPPTPPPLSPPQRQQVASSSSTTTSPRAAQGNRVFTRATRRDAIQPPRLRHLVSALFPFPWFTYLHTYTLLTHYGSNAPVFAGCGEAQTRAIARGLVP